MRIYPKLKEAVDETERELLEMGLDVASHSYQNVVTEGDKDFITKELTAYGFKVTDIRPESGQELVESRALNKLWIKAEFSERLGGEAVNPGTAWMERPKVWKQFLNDEEKFDYTYSERIGYQMERVITELKLRPNSRQAIIQVHMAHLDKRNWGGRARIPCSMHYQFLRRNEKIDVIYVMRSSDFYQHFSYDILLACMKAQWIAEKLKIEVGVGTFFFGSLHAFRHTLVERGIF